MLRQRRLRSSERKEGRALCQPEVLIVSLDLGVLHLETTHQGVRAGVGRAKTLGVNVRRRRASATSNCGNKKENQWVET
jgi:hypothetical protein